MILHSRLAGVRATCLFMLLREIALLESRALQQNSRLRSQHGLPSNPQHRVASARATSERDVDGSATQ